MLVATLTITVDQRHDCYVAPDERDSKCGVYGACSNGCDPYDGNYTCTCNQDWEGKACDRFAGSSRNHTEPEQSSSSSTDMSSGAYIWSIVGTLLAGVVLCLMILRVKSYHRQYRQCDFEEEHRALADQGLITEHHTVVHHPTELKRRHLTLLDKLGAGQFGEVWSGMLQDSLHVDGEYMVAAKLAIDKGGDPYQSMEAQQLLLQEACLMAQVGAHEHLVSIIGVVTRGLPKVLVLTYCDRGELLSILRQRAETGSPVAAGQKHQWCRDVASGMCYLASQKLVHRDLACRNVLLANAMVAKVADFGMSRMMQGNAEENSTYYRASTGLMPIRWSAPECLAGHRFSSASDAWSFGITCVEMFQDGLSPYPATRSNPALIEMVKGEHVHPKPPGCHHVVYTFLLTCWAFEPQGRPNFSTILDFFEGVAANHALDHSPDAHTFRG